MAATTTRGIEAVMDCGRMRAAVAADLSTRGRSRPRESPRGPARTAGYWRGVRSCRRTAASARRASRTRRCPANRGRPTEAASRHRSPRGADRHRSRGVPGCSPPGEHRPLSRQARRAPPRLQLAGCQLGGHLGQTLMMGPDLFPRLHRATGRECLGIDLLAQDQEQVEIMKNRLLLLAPEPLPVGGQAQERGVAGDDVVGRLISRARWNTPGSNHWAPLGLPRSCHVRVRFSYSSRNQR